MLNDKRTATTVEPMETVTVEKANEILGGPHMHIRFPLPIVQTGPKEIAVAARILDGQIFDEEFENRVRQIMGVHPGDVFLEEMSERVVRQMFIAQIR